MTRRHVCAAPAAYVQHIWRATMRRQKPQNSEPRVGLTPGGLEKPRREEAITTSNGRGLDEQKKWGSKWPAQRYRVVLSCRSTNTDGTDAALSPMMISEVPYCTLGTPRTNLGTNVISNAKPRCLWCPQPSGELTINPGTLPFRPPTSGSCIVHHAATGRLITRSFIYPLTYGAEKVCPSQGTTRDGHAIPAAHSTISADHSTEVVSFGGGGRRFVGWKACHRARHKVEGGSNRYVNKLTCANSK